jgi:hypothetical protein
MPRWFKESRFKSSLIKLWILSGALLTAMWIDYAQGHPVWPLHDIIYATLGIIFANVFVPVLAYIHWRKIAR